MDTQALKGLPPLPKSLSGLLNFNSTQWRELERLHNMRTMIQQDLCQSSSVAAAAARPRSSRTYHQAAGASSSRSQDRGTSDALQGGRGSRGVQQENEDMSPTAWDATPDDLLGQLNGRAAGTPLAAEHFDLEAATAILSRHHHTPTTVPHHQRSSSGGSGVTPRHPHQHRHPPRNLTAVAEKGAPTDSSSCSSTEYDDVL
ncbi:hypothetical protein HPB47_010545 [Ixodes persulcatus]|uniref:Uncharacterized protein n=1 Tax=Ixodes persulcatus TaxID=34615 RepID=A0AC60NYU0_IXOPE|nr:hypothetical protein HPB47_010545 [Ixodes persulcatus]